MYVYFVCAQMCHFSSRSNVGGAGIDGSVPARARATATSRENAHPLVTVARDANVATRDALTASVAFASFTLARASATATACAQKGFDSDVCAQSHCDALLDKTSSRALYDECRACCPRANDVATSSVYTRARLRVCE